MYNFEHSQNGKNDHVIQFWTRTHLNVLGGIKASTSMYYFILKCNDYTIMNGRGSFSFVLLAFLNDWKSVRESLQTTTLSVVQGLMGIMSIHTTCIVWRLETLGFTNADLQTINSRWTAWVQEWHQMLATRESSWAGICSHQPLSSIITLSYVFALSTHDVI